MPRHDHPPRPRRFPLAAPLLLLLLGALPAVAQAPDPSWTYRFGGDGGEQVFDLAVAADGRAYLAGVTDGRMQRPASGFFDLIVHAVDADGDALWLRQFDFGEFEFPYAVALAPDGDLIVAGSADGTVDGPPAGGDDAFVLRLAPDGEERWRVALGSEGRDQALAVAVAADGTIVVGGRSDGGLTGAAAGGDDAFLVALAPDGRERWRRGIASDGDDAVRVLAPTPDGGVLAGLHSTGSLGAPNQGGVDSYLRAYDASGEVVRRASLHDADDLRVFGATVVPGGAWIVVGGGPEDHDDGADVPVFVRSIAPDGGTAWSASLGPARRDLEHDVAIAPDGTLVVAATTEADVAAPAAGVADALLAGLTPDGEVAWTLQLGSPRFDGAAAVAAGPGGVWVAGTAAGGLPGGEADDAFDTDGWLRRYPF
jgi:hypothetical protein